MSLSEASPDPTPYVSARVRRAGAFHWSRPFAWILGSFWLGFGYFRSALPSERIRDMTPIPGHEWVEYPERFMRVGPFEAWRGPLAMMGLVLFAAWAATAFVPWVRRATRRDASVGLDGSQVVIRYASRWLGERRIGVDDIASVAATAGAPGKLFLRLRDGGEITIIAPQAASLADEIESARRAASTVPAGMAWETLAGGWWVRWIFATAGFVLLAGGAAEAGRFMQQGIWANTYMVATFVAVWLTVGLLGSAKQSLTVGSDGVRIDRLWRRRFLPFERLAGADAVGDVLRLRVVDAPPIRVGNKGSHELMGRINEALQQFRERQQSDLSDEHERLLAREDHDADAWKARLSNVLGVQDYRRETLRADDLSKLVGDAGADPEQRVAAALALPNDASTRARIRIAAAQTADPDTHDALEAAAEYELAEQQLKRATKRHASAH